MHEQDQGCLPGVVLFLDNEDPAVVKLAVEVPLSTISTNKNVFLSYRFKKDAYYILARPATSTCARFTPP